MVEGLNKQSPQLKDLENHNPNRPPIDADSDHYCDGDSGHLCLTMLKSNVQLFLDNPETHDAEQAEVAKAEQYDREVKRRADEDAILRAAAQDGEASSQQGASKRGKKGLSKDQVSLRSGVMRGP